MSSISFGLTSLIENDLKCFVVSSLWSYVLINWVCLGNISLSDKIYHTVCVSGPLSETSITQLSDDLIL